MAEGDGLQSNSSSGDTTALDLLGQEAGDSGRMSGLTTYLQGMCKIYMLQGREESKVAMEKTCIIGEAVDGHVRRYFGSG